MKIKIFALAALVALAGCADPVARIADTQSGNPEGVFRNKSPQAAANVLAGLCARQGAIVTASSPHLVECRKRMQGGEAVLVQALIGNSYSTTPDTVMQFNMVQEGRNTRVYASQQIETIMAFGQPRRQPLTGNAVFNSTMLALEQAGAHIDRRKAPPPKS